MTGVSTRVPLPACSSVIWRGRHGDEHVNDDVPPFNGRIRLSAPANYSTVMESVAAVPARTGDPMASEVVTDEAGGLVRQAESKRRWT